MTEKDAEMNHEEGKKKKHGIITYPSTIGPYKFYDTIGEGSFSIVKLVKHEAFSQYFACKIVPLRMLNERKMTERFELEIRISQIMRRPGIATITNFLRDENNYYVFMEYYPYGNLLNYIIDKNKLSEEESKYLMYQILNALDHIHSQKVCHRDLKLDNITIDMKGKLRISDFGLSQFVDENNLVKTPCGSPCFVSPECISGKSYNGLISDIWSCGVILYAMVTGMLPWTKSNMKELFQQIRACEYKIPNDVSEQCADLIRSFLTIDPANRITIEDAKKHIWFDIKSPLDIQKYNDYVIPISSLKPLKDCIKDEIENQNKQVPYLSIKTVDTYFRPDSDYHSDDNLNVTVSAPYMPFENTVKLLEENVDSNLKIRRRTSFSPDYSNANKLEGSNLDLKTAAGVKIQSIGSTGKLFFLNKFNDNDFPNSYLPRNKTYGVFSKDDLEIVTSDDDHDHDENDENKDDDLPDINHISRSKSPIVEQFSDE